MRTRSVEVKYVLMGSVLACLTACSLTPPRRDSSQPEPVFAIYRVKPGAEKELEGVLRRGWETYRKARMVSDQPHLCLRVREDERHTRYVEVFTWVGYFATEHSPDSVKRIWEQEGSLCEEREGHPAVEFREAEIIGR